MSFTTSIHPSPQAKEIEAAVLGAALMELDAQRTMLAILPTEDVFFQPAHREVYLAIRDLVTQGETADILSVTQQLKRRGTLTRIGGAAYIGQLVIDICSTANLESHCRILQQLYARRTIIQVGRDLTGYGYDETRDPLALLSTAQISLTNLHRNFEVKQSQTAAAVFDATFAQLARNVEAKGLTGIPTGLSQLNGLTGGWQRGDLVILAARPSMGKTAAMLHFAATAALENSYHTAIFSMEMSTHQLMERLIASEVPGYSNADLRRGNLRGGLDELQHVQQQALRLRTNGHRLHIDETVGLSIQQLRAKCTRLHAQQPLELVLVDYLQLLHGNSKNNREQEISSISRGLKELAKELNAPVIALSQLSREVEKRGDKRPQLSDLRESGSIEQDADCIIFLWRGDYYKINEYSDGTPTAGTILFDVAKHRNGATDTIIAACSLRSSSFRDF